VRQQAAQLVRDEQSFLVTGAWLPRVLAAASVAVLVGGQPGVPPPFEVVPRPGLDRLVIS
jgi:hypothetical protein